MIVADTCLIVHLFNETEFTELASQVLEKDPYWIVPRLWQEEYANVLSKLARKEKKHIEDVLRHFNYTVSELKRCEYPVDNQRALKVSIENKISVYDAHFVSLAMDFETLLITEDREICKNCPEFCIHMHDFLKLEPIGML